MRASETEAGRKATLKAVAATPKEHSTAGFVVDMLHRDEADQGHTGSRPC